MASAIYRYAVSLLSKIRFDDALPNEVLTDHSTGEILVKTEDGLMISYDTITRKNMALENAKNTALMKNIRPVIYEVQLDSPLPRKVFEYDDILAKEKIDISKTNKIILHIDLDRMSESGKELVQTQTHGIFIEYDIIFTNDALKTLDNISGSIELDKFNQSLFDIGGRLKSTTGATKAFVSKLVVKDKTSEVLPIKYAIVHNIMIIES